MKKSFVNSTSPLATVIMQVATPKQAELKIKNAVANGADAIGFQMGTFEHEYRTKEYLAPLFELAGRRPIYFTNYRGNLNTGMSDDELLDGLMFGLDCGATLVDIMGDTFDPSPEELTTNEKAIAKQMKFIDKVHAKGGEVLMSSHIYQFRSPERVLEMALEQQRRGADVCKIVTGGWNEQEELKNLEICALLKKELKIPFLFLSAGKSTYLHRTLGPALGVCMWLCFTEYDQTTYPEPPLLSNVLKIKQGLLL